MGNNENTKHDKEIMFFLISMANVFLKGHMFLCSSFRGWSSQLDDENPEVRNRKGTKSGLR